MTAEEFSFIEDERRTIDDLRVLIKEIKNVWLMGDQEVIPEAERALLDVLRHSAERLLKRSR